MKHDACAGRLRETHENITTKRNTLRHFLTLFPTESFILPLKAQRHFKNNFTVGNDKDKINYLISQEES
jgi:hypothetical protein